MIRAGGDLNLSQSNLPSDELSETQVTALRNATKNILYTVASSNAMNGLGEGVVYRYDQPLWTRALVVVDVVAIALLVLFGIKKIRRF